MESPKPLCPPSEQPKSLWIPSGAASGTSKLHPMDKPPFPSSKTSEVHPMDNLPFQDCSGTPSYTSRIHHHPRTALGPPNCTPWTNLPSRTTVAQLSCSPAYLVELLVTVGTLVLLVGVMRLQVAHLGGGVRERAPAVVTLVGLLPTVHQLVPLQVARGGEELAAVLTAVAGLTRVPLLVQVQEADESVALPTLLAAVRLQWAGTRRERHTQHQRLAAPA